MGLTRCYKTEVFLHLLLLLTTERAVKCSDESFRAFCARLAFRDIFSFLKCNFTLQLTTDSCRYLASPVSDECPLKEGPRDSQVRAVCVSVWSAILQGATAALR